MRLYGVCAFTQCAKSPHEQHLFCACHRNSFLPEHDSLGPAGTYLYTFSRALMEAGPQKVAPPEFVNVRTGWIQLRTYVLRTSSIAIFAPRPRGERQEQRIRVVGACRAF